MRGRKENSKISRLKRHLEKMGFKGIGSDSKDGTGSAHGDHRKTPPFKSPVRGGGATITTPGGQLVRANSLTLASPTAHGYGSRIVARLSSPSSGGGGPGLSINAEGLRVGGADANGGGQAESSLLSLASLSPRRMRSSISMGGRRLSAWTLRGAVSASAEAAAVDALTVEEGIVRSGLLHIYARPNR